MKKHFSRLSRSVRKYIRREKARIRGSVFDTKEAEQKIGEFVVATRALYPKKGVHKEIHKTV